MAQPGGHWERRAVRCNGRIVTPFTDPLRVPIGPGAGAVCLFINEFVAEGSIRLRKVTTGATGTTGFDIRPVDREPPVVLHQQASTARPEVPVTAAGDTTDSLPLGTYEIQETTPTGSEDGTWRLEGVVCNGVPFGSAQGRVRVRLTAETPDVSCTFTDAFARGAPGRPGDAPGEGGDGDSGRRGETSQANPRTNLRITKRVSPSAVVRGRPARSTVVVTNTGTVTAEDVVAEELQPPTHRVVNVEAPPGVRCRGTRPLRCRLGDLAPGQRVTLHATYTTPLLGRVVNRVAVHTSTAETRLSDNRSATTLRVFSSRARACAATRC
ncbi:DUF11 domain-containing protein [Solirubrobacter sp. CPCC 204708]|uniref:DUF11 domain-containing protein n=1 Tax=Solirubrobacter deserti TaxID=2282478 RepID=A0ABT4RRE3_9ACTN|nr:DUF11 domain-containing protein [Solirubrobacter deserti]MBE2319287.1 DUF11 domain-containing protein [Solirubrobacter deserti]MDA0141153.1 DUF11 domain-containing protein [Solirubrobacter deserti]